MFVDGNCRLSGWPQDALDDVKSLLSGNSQEGLGRFWDKIINPGDWIVEGGEDSLIIANSWDEIFDVSALVLVLEAVARRRGLERMARIPTWGSPEDGEPSGDGQVTFVNRYGSMSINPMSDIGSALVSVIQSTADAWRRQAAVMDFPLARIISYGRDINLHAAAMDDVVFLSDSPGNFRDDCFLRDGNILRCLDISSVADPLEIAVNLAQDYPAMKGLCFFTSRDFPSKSVVDAALHLGIVGESAFPSPGAFMELVEHYAFSKGADIEKARVACAKFAIKACAEGLASSWNESMWANAGQVLAIRERGSSASMAQNHEDRGFTMEQAEAADSLIDRHLGDIHGMTPKM